MHTSPQFSDSTLNCTATACGLENHLQRKLNVPGLRHQRGKASPAGRRSILIEQGRGSTALNGQGRRKVGVIQDVEKLRPELHTEALRDPWDREVLVQREVQVDQRRPDNTIATGIAHEIRAGTRDARIRCLRTRRAIAEGQALRSYRRRRLRQSIATGLDIAQENPVRIALVVVVDGIASGDETRNGEWVGTGSLYTERVPADYGSCRNPII